MTTATFGRSCSIVRSDSSPSTTSHPDPARALPPSCRDLAADQERRILAEPVEDESDHPGGRRLAVRTGDDDRVLQRHELGEKVSAALWARSEGQSLGHVGSGHDGFEAVRGSLDLIRDGDGDPGRAHVLEVRRLVAVPARDLRSPRLREHCIAREPCAADADEPELPISERGQAAPPRSRRRRPASRPASSPRPSPSAARRRRSASGRDPRRARARSRAR